MACFCKIKENLVEYKIKEREQNRRDGRKEVRGRNQLRKASGKRVNWLGLGDQ